MYLEDYIKHLQKIKKKHGGKLLTKVHYEGQVIDVDENTTEIPDHCPKCGPKEIFIFTC